MSRPIIFELITKITGLVDSEERSNDCSNADMQVEYYFLPDVERPRWIVRNHPLAIEAAKYVVRPTKLVSLIYTRVFFFLAGFSIARIIFPARKILEPTKPSVLMNIYCGVNGHLKKNTVQIVRDPDPYYFKLSATENADELIRNEFKWLQRIWRECPDRSFDIPECELVNLQMGRNVPVLRTSGPTNPCEDILGELGCLHLVALVEMASIRGPDELMAEQLKESKDLMAANKELFGPGFQRDLQVFLSRKIETSKLETCLAHGDFNPWNVLRDQERLFLIDWEMSGFRTLGWDLFSFCLQKGVMIDNKSSWSAVVVDNRMLVMEYFEHLGVSPDVIIDYELAFRFQMVTTYVEQYLSDRDLGVLSDKSLRRVIEVLIR